MGPERVDLGGVARRMEAVFAKMQEAQRLITEKRLREARVRAQFYLEFETQV